MPYFLAPFGNTQAFDANGNPLVGGSWRTFLAGTSTPETTYTSNTGSVQQGTTMTLDALGLPVNGPVWMVNSKALKFRLHNAAGTLLEEWDNISGIGDTSATPDEIGFASTEVFINDRGGLARVRHQSVPLKCYFFHTVQGQSRLASMRSNSILSLNVSIAFQNPSWR